MVQWLIVSYDTLYTPWLLVTCDIGMWCIEGTYKKPSLEDGPTSGWRAASARSTTGSFAQRMAWSLPVTSGRVLPGQGVCLGFLPREKLIAVWCHRSIWAMWSRACWLHPVCRLFELIFRIPCVEELPWPEAATNSCGCKAPKSLTIGAVIFSGLKAHN